MGRRGKQQGKWSKSLRWAWYNMKARCEGRGVRNQRHYAAHGITICERWANSFEAFASDMGERPSPEHSLDRIDPKGNYEPENCRWADRYVQAGNTRRSLRYRTDLDDD